MEDFSVAAPTAALPPAPSSPVPPTKAPRPLDQLRTRIRAMQDLLGHADAATTMIYTRVLNVGGGAVRSPLDTLELV